MAIQGIITNVGLSQAQLAAANEGFTIVPTKFSVSNVLSALDPTRTTANSGVFYEALISSRVVESYNTIKFICTIPPGVIPLNQTQNIRELYIYGTLNSVDFLFAIGQPNPSVLYDPTGSVTLELDISLTNADLSSIIQFNFTQATEIAEHVTDPNAHPEYLAAMNLHGMFVPSGGNPFKYRGQNLDDHVEWDGARATATHSGVIWTADHTGTTGNSIVLAFDGVLTSDQVKLIWNNAHPFNTVSHNGTGSEVGVFANVTLTGGTINVADKDAVYYDQPSGFYKKAIADGTLASKPIGFADFDGPSGRVVRASGFIAHVTPGMNSGDDVFLSSSVAGGITNIATAVKLGTVARPGVLLIGTGGGGGTGAGYDAVVTNIPGFGNYPTTAAAIAAVSSGSSILIDKLEQLTAQISTGAKRIDFTFNGPETGWTKYLGTAEKQHIGFSAVPTSGTWRIEWNAQSTLDLAYNASASLVQAAVNALTGPGLPVTVTGDYTAGFDIQWTSLVDVPEITFNDPGQNAKQRVNFGSVPDDGTIRFNFIGNDSPNLAWDDNAPILETFLESTPGITDVAVTGSFGTQQFTIEWVGVDGLAAKSPLTIAANTLKKLGVATSANMTILQAGRHPASNLKAGATHVNISIATLVNGSPVGPGNAFLVGANYTRFKGLGLVENFTNGIDLNGHTGIDIEIQFKNTITPIINTGLTPGVDYHTEKSFGISQQKIRTVGTFGDHLTLWAAVAAANDGDKIVVMSDQNLLTNQVINKDVEIVFTHHTQINVPAYLSGALLTLGTRVKTKYMKMVVSQAGVYDTIYLLTGSRGYHEDLTLDASGASVTINNGFRLDTGSTAIFCHGVLTHGAATIVSGVTNSSGSLSHDVVIRDIEGGSALTFQSTAQEFVSGGGSIRWEGLAGSGNLQWSSNLVIELPGRLNPYLVVPGTFALADGECLYVNIPPGVPVGSLTPIVAALTAVPPAPISPSQTDRAMVLFFRRGSTVYGTMHIPDLSSGEMSFIGQDLPQPLRNRIGLNAGENSYEAYSTSFAISAGDSYPTAISKLDAAIAAIIPGGGAGTPSTVQQEVPSGTVNGINNTFILAATPINTASLVLAIDGLVLLPTQYSLVGNTITIAAGSIPVAGQIVQAYYADNSGVIALIHEAITGANGVTTTFATVGTPASALCTAVAVDGLILNSSEWTLLTSPSRIQFNAGSIPQIGQNISFFSFVDGLASREVPAGTINGVNATFILSGTPANGKAILVLIDGRVAVYGTDWALIGSTIQFFAGAIPAAGSSIQAFYYIGTPGGGGGGGGGGPGTTPKVQYITLSSTDITNKYVTLTSTPYLSTNTILDVPSIGAQEIYGVDFTVSGSQLSWSGLALDGLLIAGDVFRVLYFI